MYQIKYNYINTETLPLIKLAKFKIIKIKILFVRMCTIRVVTKMECNIFKQN